MAFVSFRSVIERHKVQRADLQTGQDMKLSTCFLLG